VNQIRTALWPKWAGAVTLALSAGATLLALALFVQSMREGLASGSVEAWFASVFAVVMGVAGATGVLTGLGRIRGAEPLTLLCIGGTIFVSAVLSDSSIASRAMGRGGTSPVFAGMSIQLISIGLVAIAIIMMALSAITTLRRDPRASAPTVARGIAFAVPIVAMAAAWKVGAIRSALLSLPGLLLALLAIVALFAFVFCASACAHLLIKGFGAAAHTRRLVEATAGADNPGSTPDRANSRSSVEQTPPDPQQ